MYPAAKRKGRRAMKIDCRNGDTVADALKGQNILLTPCGRRGSCGKCRIQTLAGEWLPPTGDERRLLSSEELAQGIRLACQARGTGLCEVKVLFQTDEMHIQSAHGQLTSPLRKLRRDMDGKYGFTADLGTTTVVAQVWRGDGCLLGEGAMPNPQGAFGADVISRIESALGGRGQELQDLAAGCLDELIKEACRQAGISPGSLEEGVIVGNTAMLTLLAGEDPQGLAVFPFEPGDYFGEWYGAQELGLGAAGARIHLPRCIAGYVGADAVSAALAADLDRPGPVRLLGDIGTNGEMFLSLGGKLLCCSTAAGPAFEGGGISCGMPGIGGAISKVFLQEGQLKWETLGGTPRGVCGSGLLDAAAAFQALGLLDESGLLVKDGEPQPAMEIGDSKISLTQKDIRSLQLAKSAIRAGMETLLSRAGVLPEQVETLYLAGGFGSCLNPKSAGAIGLIPPRLAPRAEGLGNAALLGAAAILLREEGRRRALAISKEAVHLELSQDPDFMERYVEHMMF